MKFTLDMNCVIHLEEGTPEANSLFQIVEAHRDGRVQLRVPGIGASERQRDGAQSPTYTPFIGKLQAAGLASAEVLAPLACFDVTYWDNCILADDQMIALEEQIHAILFPTAEFSYSKFCQRHGLDPKGQPIDKRWLNRTCDVASLWCHIHYDGDVFVTTDKNFHKQSKKSALEFLGARQIEYPSAAVQLL